MNMIARRNPVKAPRHASVIERLLKVRSPWPVKRNPVYAIVAVQRIMRTAYMQDHLSVIKTYSVAKIALRDSTDFIVVAETVVGQTIESGHYLPAATGLLSRSSSA
jgi:hypothetical protein